MRFGIDARLWNETGIGRYIRNLVYQLIEIDNKNTYVLFVTPQVYDSSVLDFTREKTNIKIVKTDIRWHTVEEQLLFHTALQQEYLDLVHFPYFSIPILYNKPFVITIHDLIINHFPTGKASQLPMPVYHAKRFAYKFIINQAAKKSEKILTVSQATKKEIVEHLNVAEDKIVVTYEGIDERVITSTDKKNRFDLSHKKYFLYVGNAYPHKNVEMLIEAFDKVHKQNPKITLVLVGEINYFYQKIQNKVSQLSLDDAVMFTGKVTDEELAALYKHAEALVFPSYMEGFGLPGLEAMQHGTIVLASDIAVFREIYHDAAIYFDPHNSTAIAESMVRVLSDKSSFIKQKLKGKKIVEKYSWKSLAKETLAVYENAAAK